LKKKLWENNGKNELFQIFYNLKAVSGRVISLYATSAFMECKTPPPDAVRGQAKLSFIKSREFNLFPWSSGTRLAQAPQLLHHHYYTTATPRSLYTCQMY